MSKGVNPFQGPIIEALTAFIEMEATVKLVEVATMRGEFEKAEELRQRAHDLLDAHLTGRQSACVLGMHILGNKDGKSK